MKNLESENLTAIFDLVKPIVLKGMRDIRIRLWDKDDYFQEGLIILNDLLEDDRTSLENLYRHFKVKYRQHLINELRRSKAYKRMSNENAWADDITEYVDILPGMATSPEDDLLVQAMTEEVLTKLSPTYQKYLLALLHHEEVSRQSKSRLKQLIIQIIYQGGDDDHNFSLS